MKQLATLIRLRKRELDGVRQHLAKLENRRDKYISQIEQLSEELKSEYLMAAELSEMRGFFGDFSGHIKKRQHILAAHVVQTETQIQHTRAELQEQFSELKKYEIAKEQFDAKQALAAKRKEQMEMDEIGIRNAIFMDT